MVSERQASSGAQQEEALAIIAHDMHSSGGSVGAVAWRHALLLSRRQRIYVISRAVPESVYENVRPVLVEAPYWNWLRRFCHVPNELAFLWFARKKLHGLCARERIKLVWCHSHSTASLLAAPLKKRFGFGLIMTTHGDIFDRPRGVYSPELTWFYKLLTPMAYRQADAVQVLSPYMADLAVRGGAIRDRVRLIPNGIDPKDIGMDKIEPRSPESFAPEGVLRLLYVGGLWSLKGVDTLIRAVAELTDPKFVACKHLGEEIRGVGLTIVGDGILKSEMETLVNSLGISDKVVFLGQRSRNRLAACYRQADILCVPSMSEALPTVVLEALSCGTPVIGSKTGGIIFLVDEGHNGYLAAPGDVKSLVSCVIKSSRSRAHLAELGKQGFDKARTMFDWDEIAKQLEKLVDDICRYQRNE